MSKVVVPTNRARDIFVAAIIALLVLGFIGYGVYRMAQPVQGNKLTGVIVEKQFTALKEQRINFAGRKIEGIQESEGEFLLKVRVDSENGRIYDVPVAKSLYESKKAGDPLTFVRPPSEQR